MIANSSDFRALLADFGVSVTVGSTTAQAVVAAADQADDGEQGFGSGYGAGSQRRGEVIGQDILAVALVSDFPANALAIDATLTVNAGDFTGSYVIRGAYLRDAGFGVMELHLRRQ